MMPLVLKSWLLTDTSSVTLAALCGGALHSSWVLEMKRALAGALPVPNLQVRPFPSTKFLPVTCTGVPPRAGPITGSND